MKIVVTGSLGKISKPLAILLLKQGHEVTVISSKAERKAPIEALGATAAIGTIADVKFLTAAFTGADAVYTMLPPPDYTQFDPDADLLETVRQVGNNYATAIKQSGVKRVVHLSSVGAHLNENSGLLIVHHILENILGELPADISVTFLRPTAFYDNLYSYMDMIRGKGFLGRLLALRYYGFIPMLKGKTGIILGNYGADDKMAWVSPADIAAVTAEELTQRLVGREIRYVASEELTCNQVAGILGAAIGKPYLKWAVISNKQMQRGMESAGLPRVVAAGLVEMYASVRTGLIEEDYYRKRPKVMGNVKMRDFAKEFAAVYNK